MTAVIGPPQVAELRPFPLSVRTPMPYFAGATDRVRFVGEPVAVVVAADRYLAEDAAELVDVDYEELPVVTGTAHALAAEAPRLHPEAESNVATDRTFSFGPVDEAFADADHVVSGDYSFPRYSSMPMECYSVVANWTETAEGPAVEAWANFHGPFSMIPVLAASLGVPASRLRLHVPADIGGSFGIKAGIYPYVTLMALASKHARHPVRWTEDRLEHLVASSAGADRLMRFEAAVTADGTVTALRADLIDNVGAYLRPPEPSTLYRCFGNITGAYRIPAVRIRARAVVTNKTPTGLNRGFGGQQLYFGLERLMDKVAAVTGLDPAEARRRNFIGAGEFPYRTPTGGVYDSGDYRQAFDLALKNADYDALRAGAGSGPRSRGVLRHRARRGRRPVGHQHRLRRAGHPSQPAGRRAREVRLDRAGPDQRRPRRHRDGAARHGPAGPGPRHRGPPGGRGPARPAAGAGPAGGRDGHRDHPVDDHLGQLLVRGSRPC